jgi:hypothetical protein
MTTGVFVLIASGMLDDPGRMDKALYWIYLLGAFLLALFYGVVVVVFSKSAEMASKEALQFGVDDISALEFAVAARWLRHMMTATAVAGASSVCVQVLFFFLPLFPSSFSFWFSWSRPLSVMTNVVASALLAGLLVDRDGERRNSKQITVGAMCIHAQRRQEIEIRLGKVVGMSTGSALTIASLMDGADPHDCLREAASRFRCIRWDALAKMPGIIIAGGPLDGLESLGNDLYSLSEPCQLGACDFFFLTPGTMTVGKSGKRWNQCVKTSCFRRDATRVSGSTRFA